MHYFIVICVIAVAMAAPQGYNYNPAISTVHNLGFTSANFGSGVVNNPLVGLQSSQNTLFGQNSGGPPASHHQHQTQQAVVSKRFYIHSAPEENDEEFREKHITVGVPRKNYNVVFIKAPAKSTKKTAIKISPAVNEEKTVIYVLSKKHDSSDVEAEVVEHATPTTKPEVFFIKYKTNEEASHAQQQIQSQYDALGGSSQITDEGVAPVTSVIGALGGENGGTNSLSSGGEINNGPFINGGSSTSQSNNAYLPPNFA